MGAHKLCNMAILVGAVLVGSFSAGGVVSGQPGPAGSDSPGQILLDLLDGHEEIVFACRQEGHDGHWYANFGYYAGDEQRKAFRALGRLCKLNVRTGELTNLVDDPEGTVRDPQVHYDGRRIVFSYRKGGSDSFHLYEINVDGTGLRQLTDGPYNDIEPTYLADGGILFCSDRCNRWVNCWLTKVAVMYRCDGDGSNVRQISSNSEHENTPWPLPDGRVLYQRWEYVDRSQVHYHHLWTTNPDGTGQMVFYGNMHPGIVMIDAKPIPGTEKVVAVFSPGHGRREHAGAITILSPKHGPDELAAARRISNKDNYRDPYPLSANQFLVAQEASLLLMDDKGAVKTVYKLPEELARAGVKCHEPRPVVPRARERTIAARAELKETTGKLILSDVYNGRRMDGVNRGEIKKLLILETLPMPIHYTGGMDPVSFGGTFTLERVLGTVPVESDGSAYLELPALRSFFFVALDENDDSVKRMQSFLTVMPGETTSCVGCHEHRTRTPENRSSMGTLIAMKRPPSKIEPVEGIPDVFEFPRDIQPILDRHCVECHDYDKYDGGVILTGDRGPMFSHSYYTLTYLRQFVDGRDNPISSLAPRSIGASASPLMKKIAGEHYDVKVSPAEAKMIRFWIEAGAPYPGTYGALGSGMIGGYYENRQVNTDFKWEPTMAAGEAIRRRCVSCHSGEKVIPVALSDERGVSFWKPDPDDPRLRMTRHLVFNLTRPEKSLMLLAPLAKEAGGYGFCKVDAAVFVNADDPDYQKILAMCKQGKTELEKIKRFDMPGFVPPAGYVSEMKRYGILPADLPEDTVIDVYATDRKYWQSLWHTPEDLPLSD